MKMLVLLQKEISTFFSSLTGYLAVGIFLVLNGLFLWVIPGTYNIPLNGYANIEGLFLLAPWIFLVLVPAIAMRSFAEERRTGTLEILLVRPMRVWEIVMAKYLAGVGVIIVALLPTLIYVVSVYYLGNPVGNLDLGATVGSYWGLFFLGAIYMAIGLFTSSLTSNQIVAYLLGAILCFLVFSGFSILASLPWIGSWSDAISRVGIESHYRSISRGVIDMRDIIYFISTIFLILFCTGKVLGRKG